jgi:hypothetical protein
MTQQALLPSAVATKRLMYATANCGVQVEDGDQDQRPNRQVLPEGLDLYCTPLRNEERRVRFRARHQDVNVSMALSCMNLKAA